MQTSIEFFSQWNWSGYFLMDRLYRITASASVLFPPFNLTVTSVQASLTTMYLWAEVYRRTLVCAVSNYMRNISRHLCSISSLRFRRFNGVEYSHHIHNLLLLPCLF
jgi:hypothetical protein